MLHLDMPGFPLFIQFRKEMECIEDVEGSRG